MKGKGRVHRALKLVHHQHTARPLAHHHTSYRALFVVLAIAGLTMATIQYATAADYQVVATVPGAALTDPAVITSPLDGVTVNDPNVTVRGTCQVVISSTFVSIAKDGQVLGTGPCQADGTFAIDVTLDLGANALMPTELSGDAQNGPDGSIISVIHALPPVPSRPSTSASTITTTTTPEISAPRSASSLAVRIKPQGPGLIERSSGKAVTIVFSIANGLKPFVVTADWGDGKTDTVHIVTAGESIRLQHTYDVPGAYTITLRATDSIGHKAVYQYVAAIQVGALSLSAPSAALAAPTVDVTSWATLTRVVWTLYGLLSFAVIALWLASPTHTLLLRPVPVRIARYGAGGHRSRRG